MPHVPLKLYGAAAGIGFAYANLGVALPLYVLAAHRSPAFAGALLAAQAAAIAVGALLVGPVVVRVGAWGTVAVGSLVTAAGAAALLLAGPDARLLPGTLLTGIGMGFYWVGTQAVLGSRSGSGGSERGFVVQYASYVGGVAAGAAGTGVAAWALRAAGAGHANSIRLTVVLGAVAAGAAG